MVIGSFEFHSCKIFTESSVDPSSTAITCQLVSGCEANSVAIDDRVSGKVVAELNTGRINETEQGT
jgi:hypothetical protein